MAAAGEEALKEREGTTTCVVAWRFECLVRSGYSDEDAAALACDLAADLHLALELIDRGCPAALARRIIL